MKQLGDITKINGAEIEPVDVITGGSPCQDLSVAGKRAGLAGARSGLFMEQIRVIKEIRQHERDIGRSDELIRPRYMVWENVPGAFSSNKGEDFRAVLEEICRVSDGNADVPQPPNGKWANAGCIMGNGWSIAWRVHDAQFWGVPQRRRRIALVADFGGHTAPEILFERDGLCWNPPQSGESGQGTAGDFEDGVGEAIGLTNRGIVSGDVAETARAECHGALPMVCAGFKLGNSEQARSIGFQEERSPTLNAECGGNKPAICYDMTHATDVIRECGETAPTLQSRMGTGGNQIPLTLENRVCDEIAHTVKQNTGSTFREDSGSFVCEPAYQGYAVRRLTPLECERLQGYPDGWTDIGEWTDSKGKVHKPADSARYKALGNSIALPFWFWMLKRMSAYLPDGATLGSLFDGIGGFPLCWERTQGKGTALWASEIEPFPIRVTEYHFGGLNE